MCKLKLSTGASKGLPERGNCREKAVIRIVTFDFVPYRHPLSEKISIRGEN